MCICCFVTISSCSIHGHGLFKIKKSFCFSINHDVANKSYLNYLPDKTHIHLEIWENNIKVGPED